MKAEIDTQKLEKKYQSSIFKGSIKAPFSKSYTQRAIAIALLADGKMQINNPAWCDDTLSTLTMAKYLGAKVTEDKNCITIESNFKILSKKLSAGESGLALRMFTPIVALRNETISITGKGSLLNRPVSMMDKPLRSLGVNLSSNKGLLPISIHGPLAGGEASIDGSISSQFLTGLLIALPLAKKDSVLKVINLQSIPYIDMTLDIINHFGIEIKNTNYKQFQIEGKQKYQARNYTVEGDWSNAAFLLVSGAISGQVKVEGLNPKSKQADVAILKALELAGADIHSSDQYISVNKSDLKRFEFDATHCPDLFPPLVILAAVCKGTSTIKGTRRLIHKESNRAIVLQKELDKIGIKIELKDDLMIVQGGIITGGKLHSNNDHRIAMAGTIASLVSLNSISIQQAEAVNKSYPDFYTDFEAMRK